MSYLAAEWLTRAECIAASRDELLLLRDLTAALIFPNENARRATMHRFDVRLKWLVTAAGVTEMYTEELLLLRCYSGNTWLELVDDDEDGDDHTGNWSCQLTVDCNFSPEDLMYAVSEHLPTLQPPLPPLPRDYEEVTGETHADFMPWLAEQLYQRGIAMLEIETGSDSYAWVFARESDTRIDPLLAWLHAAWDASNDRSLSGGYKHVLKRFDAEYWKRMA